MTHVPALRAALQDAADRRYGRARLRRPLIVVVPALAAALIALVVLRFPVDTERVTSTPVHAVSTTMIPAPEQTMRAPTPMLLSPQEAAREYAAAQGKGSVYGTLVSAWTVPGIERPIFLTRDNGDYCLILWYPGDPGYGMGCAHESRRSGAQMHDGDTIVAWVPPGVRAPRLTPPGGSGRALEPGPGGLIALTGVSYPSTLGDSKEPLGLAPIKRFECSDGTHEDVPVDRIWNEDVMGPFDPCAE
jgi:hypothetical protein